MIFVDSSFWIGLADTRDERHEQATLLIRAKSDAALVTTNHVLGETWTFLRKRLDHRLAVRFLDAMEATEHLQKIRVPEALEGEAWTWLRRRDERVYSFVDATSFAVMRKHRITEALAFDGDFAAAGFVELRT